MHSVHTERCSALKSLVFDLAVEGLNRMRCSWTIHLVMSYYERGENVAYDQASHFEASRYMPASRHLEGNPTHPG